MITYYCPKCKHNISEKVVSNNKHCIMVKNGNHWWETYHTVIRIIEKSND